MRQLRIAVLVFFLVIVVAFSAQGQSIALDVPTPNVSARQIIDRSIAVYANCNSYVDEGEVKTIFYQLNGPRTVIKPFTTAFVRPSAFRFEYQELRDEGQGSRYIIWQDAEGVKTWWSIKPGVKSPPSLAMALVAATGVSSLASFTVPALLMPDTRIGSEFKSFSAWKMQEQEINGSQAYKIEGTDVRASPVTFWLDKETLLIVKIFRKHKFPNFETETTTTYRPKINVGADGKLAFNAPGTGR